LILLIIVGGDYVDYADYTSFRLFFLKNSRGVKILYIGKYVTQIKK